MGTTARHSSAHKLGKFFTSPPTAAACLAHLAETLPGLNADLFLEPSAGAGAFLHQMPAPRLGLDIAPEGPEIDAQDFLHWQPQAGTGRIVVIGNPPFGRNGAEAARFFNHAAGFAETIAFIMPASFMKTELQKRLDPQFHLISQLPLIDEPFLFKDMPHNVSAVFQVWSRNAMARGKPVKRATTHPDFQFVKSLAEADFVMRRVGARAGAILSVPLDGNPARGVSAQSNLYVKAQGIDPDVLRQRFQAFDLENLRRQSISPSVSKSDLVALYSDAMATTASGTVAPCPKTASPRPSIKECPVALETRMRAPKPDHAAGAPTTQAAQL